MNNNMYITFLIKYLRSSFNLGIIMLSVMTLFANGACKRADKLNKKDVEEEPIKIPSSSMLSDMALIYHGGQHRPAYSAEQIKYYVFRDNGGKPEWLFDGFLFIEATSSINGHLYDFGVSRPDAKAPGKAEWDWLLNRIFAKAKGPDAIEQTLDSLTKKGFPPPFKRKIVISLPNPIYGKTDWGAINHLSLNFNKLEDRYQAVNWYIEKVLEKWKEKDYQYLELSGFYWLHETIDSKYEDDKLVKKIHENLKNKKLNFEWIPYYGAEKANQWKDLGFTIAYQQPNYYFNLSTPMWVLTGAVDFAFQHDMQLEMEFDDRIETPEFRQRFYDYVQVFEEKGVWEKKQVAYYNGGGAWMRMSMSKDLEIKKMTKVLGDILVKRQKAMVEKLKR